MREGMETFGPQGQRAQSQHFLEEKQLKSSRQYYVCILGGISPKYGEFVASKEHSEVVGNSAPKVL